MGNRAMFHDPPCLLTYPGGDWVSVTGRKRAWTSRAGGHCCPADPRRIVVWLMKDCRGSGSPMGLEQELGMAARGSRKPGIGRAIRRQYADLAVWDLGGISGILDEGSGCAIRPDSQNAQGCWQNARLERVAIFEGPRRTEASNPAFAAGGDDSLQGRREGENMVQIRPPALPFPAIRL